MQRKTTGISAALLFAVLHAPAAHAAPNTLTGSIAGIVSNALGVPQMGASVFLFNRLEKQVGRVLTDDRGSFSFDALPSDIYSIRITLASFLPAMRANLGVQPGIRKLLSVNLTGVLSTIELVYSLPLQQGMMSDDWKWTLRSATATRPILRVLSADGHDPLRQLRTGSAIFSGTRGVVKLSAGESTPGPTLGSQPDLGTAFALATSIYGNNHVEFSGNLGYASANGNPAAGIRTTFSRQVGEGRTPEVAVTMRQIFLFGHAGTGIATGQPNIPAFRSMAISMSDKVHVTDSLLVTYGATLESVQFVQRLNYVSPFAKFSYDLDDLGAIEFGYSSGLPPTQLYSNNGTHEDTETQDTLRTLALFPRVSLRGGQAHVQRTQNYEAGYHRKLGSRTFNAAAYRESIANAALSAVGADGAFEGGEVLPDMFSRSSVLNAGKYQSVGYVVSVTQSLGDNWSATVGYGNTGVLEASRDTLTTNEAAELRSLLQTNRRHWAVTRIAGYIPQTGTRFTTSYQFMNGRGLTPGHFYMTQRLNPEQGLNVQVRQPLPGLPGMPGKIEATADIRNMLAQGYQPITMPDGRRLQLVHSPRALRGGLAFIF